MLLKCGGWYQLTHWTHTCTHVWKAYDSFLRPAACFLRQTNKQLKPLRNSTISNGFPLGYAIV